LLLKPTNPELRITNCGISAAFSADKKPFVVDWRDVFIRLLTCSHLDEDDGHFGLAFSRPWD